MSTGDDRGDRLEAFLARVGASAADEEMEPLWKEGREVGEWTVAGFVGRGGSAEVYCARHRRLGTAAVLKVLWRGGEGPRERFDRETRFLMEGPGASFPVCYGTGLEEGRPWVAMELLEEYPPPKTDAGVAAYLLDAARGVAELHRRGWVHRDLKPKNILRRASDGHAVLIDFGLLKRSGEDPAAVTAAGKASPSVVDGREVGVGTPGYAAPEQFAGGMATPASDVHALGMLADECFGGKPPRAWERIIRRATGSLPRQRYADAAAMARAIRRRHWRRNAGWALFAALFSGVAVFSPFPADSGVLSESEMAEAVRALDIRPEPSAGGKVERIDSVFGIEFAHVPENLKQEDIIPVETDDFFGNFRFFVFEPEMPFLECPLYLAILRKDGQGIRAITARYEGTGKADCRKKYGQIRRVIEQATGGEEWFDQAEEEGVKRTVMEVGDCYIEVRMDPQERVVSLEFRDVPGWWRLPGED